MTFGEFYRRLVAHGPELIGRAQYYQAVKKAIEQAAAEFNHSHKLKPEYRLEWLELCTEKWFGSPTITDKATNEDNQHNRKPAYQKTQILDNTASKKYQPPCFGDPFTQPECRLCHLLEKCCLEATHR